MIAENLLRKVKHFKTLTVNLLLLTSWLEKFKKVSREIETSWYRVAKRNPKAYSHVGLHDHTVSSTLWIIKKCHGFDSCRFSRASQSSLVVPPFSLSSRPRNGWSNISRSCYHVCIWPPSFPDVTPRGTIPRLLSVASWPTKHKTTDRRMYSSWK